MTPIAAAIRRPTIGSCLPSFAQAIDKLSPMLFILEQCASGTIDSINGRPVFKDWEGEWTEIPLVLREFTECFERIAAGEKHKLELWPIKKLGNKLEYGMPLLPADIGAAQLAMHECISLYLATPVARIREYTTVEMISIELDRINATAKTS